MTVSIITPAVVLRRLGVIGGAPDTMTKSNVYPFPWPGSAQVLVVNKVWDSVAGDWVPWATIEKDIDGREYPGPGVFGGDTSNFRLQDTILVSLDS
jgi:hypothetical protein